MKQKAVLVNARQKGAQCLAVQAEPNNYGVVVNPAGGCPGAGVWRLRL